MSVRLPILTEFGLVDKDRFIHHINNSTMLKSDGFIIDTPCTLATRNFQGEFRQVAFTDERLGIVSAQKTAKGEVLITFVPKYPIQGVKFIDIPFDLAVAVLHDNFTVMMSAFVKLDYKNPETQELVKAIQEEEKNAEKQKQDDKRWGAF